MMQLILDANTAIIGIIALVVIVIVAVAIVLSRRKPARLPYERTKVPAGVPPIDPETLKAMQRESGKLPGSELQTPPATFIADPDLVQKINAIYRTVVLKEAPPPEQWLIGFFNMGNNTHYYKIRKSDLAGREQVDFNLDAEFLTEIDKAEYEQMQTQEQTDNAKLVTDTAASIKTPAPTPQQAPKPSKPMTATIPKSRAEMQAAPATDTGAGVGDETESENEEGLTEHKANCPHCKKEYTYKKDAAGMIVDPVVKDEKTGNRFIVCENCHGTIPIKKKT